MFRVGQKVVCVDVEGINIGVRGHVLSKKQLPNTPVLGGIYTIREFDDDDAIRLCEIRNPVRRWRTGMAEASFWLRRFRPVVDTDISIFTAMLTPSDKKVPA